MEHLWIGLKIFFMNVIVSSRHKDQHVPYIPNPCQRTIQGNVSDLRNGTMLLVGQLYSQNYRRNSSHIPPDNTLVVHSSPIHENV